MKSSAVSPSSELHQIHDRIRRAVRERCPSHLIQSADDVAQDLLLKVLRSPVAKRRCLESMAYVRTAARRALIDVYRSKQRRRRVLDDYRDTARCSWSLGQSASVFPDPVLRRSMLRVFDRLRPEQRAAVVGYLEQRRIPEIAEIRGWSQRKANNTVYRSLARLRSELRARGVEVAAD